MTRPLLVALVVAACATPESNTPAPSALVLADSVEHLSNLAREPMVVRHPGGALFVTGYGDTLPHLWRSDDEGKQWRTVNVGSRADGAIGNSDVDLAVGPDGTLYYMNMSFDRTRLVGTRIDMGVSRDTGATWQWTQLSNSEFDDRPWVDVAPDGTVHTIWNDGAGVSHTTSADSGRTWKEGARVSTRGGSSHLAVGQNGEVAVRVVPLSASGNRFDAGVEFLAISTDRGATWQQRELPGQRAWFPMKDTTVTPSTWVTTEEQRWVEPLAWDAEGALYSFWASERVLWLARSRDQGATWTSWQIATSDAVAYFPYLIARGRGELAASWFTGKGDSVSAHLAHLRVPTDSAPPAIALAPPFQLEAFAAREPGQPPVRDTAGEYFGLTFMGDGSIGLATTIQNPVSKRLGFLWRRYRLSP